MSDFYILAGVSGIGKTTVMQKVILVDKKIKGFVLLDEMKEVAKKKFKIKDENKISKLLDVDDIFTEMRRLAVEKIRKNKNKKIILETHFAMWKKLFVPEISLNELMKFKLKKIFLIEASPSEVRKLWTTKLTDDVEEYLERERSYAEFVSDRLKIPLRIIKSTNLEKIAKEILKEVK